MHRELEPPCVAHCLRRFLWKKILAPDPINRSQSLLPPNWQKRFVKQKLTGKRLWIGGDRATIVKPTFQDESLVRWTDMEKVDMDMEQVDMDMEKLDM